MSNDTIVDIELRAQFHANGYDGDVNDKVNERNGLIAAARNHYETLQSVNLNIQHKAAKHTTPNLPATTINKSSTLDKPMTPLATGDVTIKSTKQRIKAQQKSNSNEKKLFSSSFSPLLDRDIILSQSMEISFLEKQLLNNLKDQNDLVLDRFKNHYKDLLRDDKIVNQFIKVQIWLHGALALLVVLLFILFGNFLKVKVF